MRAGLFVRVFGLVFAAILIIPTVVVTATAFTEGSIITFPPQGMSWRWFEEVLTDPVWTGAIRTSLTVGVLAAVIAVVVGTSLALAAARGGLLPSSLVVAVGMTPMVVPLVVVAIGVYFVYVRIGLYGGILSLALAHAVLGVPFVLVNVLAALRSLDPHVEEAARACGAGPVRTLLRVTVPQILPAALIGGLFAFITSWDEVVVAIFLNTPTLRTLPVVIWGQVRSGLEPSTSAVATILTVVSLVVFALTAAISSRRSRSRRVH
ncbi:ABC transporter permease [Jiangella alba]|uniref:Putative spermidine/putrescine transport system permease protein n=1 Tax=Jiangella alba TaxID=561176 RepID=A0A1H5PYX1_9ACTN|nr:ABC transporter permease [Jiangella alba]SEF18854.1 putative spermidine/putrescine transport system permease protein [Jiangella alba]